VNQPIEVVIVGGGTAGWMAAAGLITQLPPSRYRIRLVESEEIGTVGVGEATLPHIKEFNDSIGLDEVEMMRRSKASFKLGIEFVGWGFEGSRYIHPFGTHGRSDSGPAFHQLWLRALQAGHKFNLEDLSFAIAASRANRFDFPSKNPHAVNSTYAYAYHFDSSLYAGHLREFAEGRGVLRTEGKITDVALDPESGAVRSLTLNSGEVVEGDFFIDCSGFRSLILGNRLGVEWEDWSKWLPCDRAFAVPSERSADLTPYTRSTVRRAGWQGRIPLQHRTGNGYVFSSQFITEDEAAAELLANLDTPALDEPRLLRFQAGRRARSWERNCVALGLASGFLEPLESTSIYLIQIAIMHLLPLFPDSRVDSKAAAEFNRKMDVEYDRIRDFLILHYHLTKREETEIWKYCRHMDVPDSLRAKMGLFEHRGHIEQYRDGLFTPPSWLSVYVGQGLQPRHYHPRVAALPVERVVEELTTLQDDIRDRVDEMPSHAAFLARYCPADGPALETVP
jgi:tryptophan halogenase